ncbi:MAG: Crp/Fnr family transcriptional regulator, partial [Bacteroidota bacterium]
MKSFLQSFDLFSEAEIDEVLALGKSEKLAKGEHFIKEGSVCRKLAFIESGLVRTYYHSSEGEQITYCFFFAGQVLSAYSSWITAEPTSENLEALVDTQLFVLPKSVLEEREARDPRWLLLSKIIAEQQYLELEKRIFLLQKEKAEKRYADLLQR